MKKIEFEKMEVGGRTSDIIAYILHLITEFINWVGKLGIKHAQYVRINEKVESYSTQSGCCSWSPW